MIKLSIFNLFKKSTSNKEILDKEIGKNLETEICSESQLRRILKKQYVHSYNSYTEQSKKMLKDIDAYIISTHEVCLKEYCYKLGLNNCKGMIIDNRIEAIKEHSEYFDYRYTFDIGKKLSNNEIKFIKNGDLIEIEVCENKKKYIPKSQKEKELKKLYDYLEREWQEINREFKLVDNTAKYRPGISKYKSDESLMRERINKEWVSVGTSTFICKETKPNRITDFELNSLGISIANIAASYQSIYTKYLLYRLESIKKEYEVEMYGRIGEENVIEATNDFDNCIAIHNVLLPATKANGEEYLFEIDTILVTTRGIFILEVKNYGTVGDYELRIDGTGRWSIYYPDSDKEVTRDNPNKQNNMHVINFNKFINKYLPHYNGEIDSIGVIVIGNDDVKITQENPNTNIKRVDELYNYIKEHSNKKFSLQEINEIAKCIEKYRAKKEKSYPINDFADEILNNIKFIREDLKLMKEIRSSLSDDLLDIINKSNKVKAVYPKRKVKGIHEQRCVDGMYYTAIDLGITFKIYSKEDFDVISETY